MTEVNEEAAYDAWTDIEASPRATHRVVWRLTSETITGTVLCDGDTSSPCHAYCPDGCELMPCPHMPVQGPSCGRLPWFDEDGLAEFYRGPETTVRDAPVTLWWDDDCYLWRYET